MKRVVIVGRGAAGKSTLAVRLGAVTGLPVAELDKLFWSPNLTALPHDEWVAVQHKLIDDERWILDGDLGPFDALAVRLAAADTVVVLDFPLWRCAWRAVRRSRENVAFWRWLITYRRRSLPRLRDLIARHARGAEVYTLRNPRSVDRFVADTVHIRRD